MSEQTSESRYWIPAYILCGIVAGVAGYFVVERKPLMVVAGVSLGLLALAASYRLGRSQGLFIALLAIFAFTIPMSGVRVSQTTALSDVIMLPLIALVFLMTTRTKDTVVPEMKPLMIGGAIISACGIASSFTAADVTLALFGAFRVFVATVLLPWALGTIRLTTPLARLMTWAWMAGLMISSVLGFVHFKTPFGRVLGLTTHENHFGLTVVFGVGVALALYLSEKGFLRYVAFGCLAIASYGVIESGSRASLLGMVLAVAIFVVRTRRAIFLLWGWLAIVVSFAVLATGLVQLPEYNALARLFGGGNASVEIADDVRAEAHEWAVEKIDRNPLFGGGFDEAEIVHNVYLQIWASAGLLALAAFLLVMLAAARPALAPKVLHPSARKPWDRRALLSLGYSVGCIGYFLIALTSNIFWTRYVWFQIAMAVALSSRRYAEDRVDPDPEPTWPMFVAAPVAPGPAAEILPPAAKSEDFNDLFVYANQPSNSPNK